MPLEGSKFKSPYGAFLLDCHFDLFSLIKKKDQTAQAHK